MDERSGPRQGGKVVSSAAARGEGWRFRLEREMEAGMEQGVEDCMAEGRWKAESGLEVVRWIAA